MPRFYLQKLVRDKLEAEYQKFGQKPQYKSLSKSEYVEELKKKLIEEIRELDPLDKENIRAESADVLQVLHDLWQVHGIEEHDVKAVLAKKYERLGGFSGATYVEYLDLQDDDEWVEYYRKEPKRFPESLHPAVEDLDIPSVEPGEYEHYKGNHYTVLGIGLETETLEPYVIYTSQKDKGLFWTRPYEMFVEDVVHNGVSIPRFRKLTS